ncbi:MAG TPA: type II toxin-antitoxin system VapC family toxin [Terracidiphilus sp.]|jgi:PIN domain nuclease of toxin-antitoxin system
MTETEIDRSRPLLLDTHALVWMVNKSARLGGATSKALDEASFEDRLAVSAITPWEIALLVSKQRLTLNSDVMVWLNEAMAKPGLKLVELEPEIAVASTRLPFEMHPDPADRILVATVRHLGATLVTADKPLLELAKKGYFRALDAGK